tara:strand:+ start:2615 stop:3061 length:447 start_codon:yes stop_codon:yes gene_type:complete
MPGLTIDAWGPAGWNTLHAWAHFYPHAPTDAERDAVRALLHLFARHLPCPSCRTHFTAFLERRLDAEALATRSALVALLNDAHNEVNARLGKRVYTLEEHRRVYTLRRRMTARVDPRATLLPVAAVAVLLGAVVMQRRSCQRVPLWYR